MILRSSNGLHRLACLLVALISSLAVDAAVDVQCLRVPKGFRIELLTDAVPNVRGLALGRVDGDLTFGHRHHDQTVPLIAKSKTW